MSFSSEAHCFSSSETSWSVDKMSGEALTRPGESLASGLAVAILASLLAIVAAAGTPRVAGQLEVLTLVLGISRLG